MKQNASVIDALAWLWDVFQDLFWLIGAVGLALAARGRENRWMSVSARNR